MGKLSRLLGGVCLTATFALTAGAAAGATRLPVLWTAGAHDASTTGAGEAARVASDGQGNVAVVSGPTAGIDLVVTSYTSGGALRWRRAVSPSAGAFRGDWVAAAPGGDVVAVGRTFTSSGNPIAITLVRFTSAGTLAWRVDLARTLPAVGRLAVDGAGSTYLVFNAVGDGQDIQLHKYDTSGVLLWSRVVSTGIGANDIATSLALSPDQADVALTGYAMGAATWITAVYKAATGARRWLVTAPEGTARDVVVDPTRVYVTGQGFTGSGAPSRFLTVVALERATGAQLWRTDRRPADSTQAMGLRMERAPDGSLVVAGQASRGSLDWYTVAIDATGAVRWEALRDGGLNADETPSGLLVTDDGTTVVTGPGGPNLPGGSLPGVTAGYDSSGTLLWEAFSAMATTGAAALPGGDVCAAGGYDALVTCWRLPNADRRPPTPLLSANPSTAPR